VHINSVKHGLLQHVADRLHSTFHCWVLDDGYPVGFWGGKRNALHGGLNV